jgi:hypothetical protein
MFTLPPRSQEVSQPLEYGEPPEYQLDIHSDPSPATSPVLSMSTLQAHNRTALNPELSGRKFHLPSRTPLVLRGSQSAAESDAAKMDDLYEPGTPNSSTFPKFASPSQASSMKSPMPAVPNYDDQEMEGDELSDYDAVSSPTWERDRDASVTTEIVKELDERHISSARLDRNSESCPPDETDMRLTFTYSIVSTICIYPATIESDAGDLATRFLPDVRSRLTLNLEYLIYLYA